MSCPSDLRQHMLLPPSSPRLPRLLQLHDIFFVEAATTHLGACAGEAPREHLSEINAVRKIIN